MLIFETILVLLLGATVLSAFAKRVQLPYPALLALGGAALVFVPGAPRLELPPELTLAVFVAPVLFDAAYSVSLRDLRRNWLAVTSLALIAVVVTTAAVAVVTRWLMPDMPWGAAIALGALVAPPDAVAALTILRQINPPFRIRVILEGESLWNDASALLIYKLAVATVAVGGLSEISILPMLVSVGLGSVLAGWLLAWPVGLLMRRVEEAPTAVIIQFVMTFAVWLLSERLGLSSIVTIVVFALTLAQAQAFRLPARLRLPSFAVWEVVTTILNVLAFTLIGLQLGPILEALQPWSIASLLGMTSIILLTVIAVRIAWTMILHAFAVVKAPREGGKDGRAKPLSIRNAIVVGWSGMRGIVTLAAALALPAEFPYRDFIQLAAFVVVLGTLLLQGLTLGPLLKLLRFPQDTLVDREVRTAREAALTAALEHLKDKTGPSSRRLQAEYEEALRLVQAGSTPYAMHENVLRTTAVEESRKVLEKLRASEAIGDEAYRIVEEELDREELSATPRN